MDIKLLSVKDLSVRWQKDEGTTGTEAYIYIFKLYMDDFKQD